MAEMKFKPVARNQKTFLKKASKRRGFREAYEALAVEYAFVGEMLSARKRAGLTQEAVAKRMGTTKSAVSRLEAAGKHAPSMGSLTRYANAVGCSLKIELVPQRETLVANNTVERSREKLRAVAKLKH
jgi:DNA-binding XRE family transcriptional regulator